MIDLGACEITGLFGPMASGKTYLINQWLKDQNRYVRFDATGESMDDPGVSHVWRSAKDLYLQLRQNPCYFRVAFHPGVDMYESFEGCCRALCRFDTYKLIVVDEFHEVCSVNDTPEYVRTLLRYARHARLGIVGASQRIADVHKLFTAGSRRTILFNTVEARDLDAIASRWGSDCADTVSALRPLLYDDSTGIVRQIPQCVVIPRGSKPQIYDFKTGAYVSTLGERSDSETSTTEDERETSDSVPERQDDIRPGDRGSDSAPSPNDGGLDSQ